MSALVLEPAGCPRCNVALGQIVRQAESWLDDVPGVYEVRRCNSCGLWVTSPRLRANDLPLAYPAGYHRIRLDDSRFPSQRSGDRSLLDVGCGVGDSLVQARSRGWHCVGVEISSEAAEIARSRGFEVILGDATRVEFPSERFDVVRCWHTLEHVQDPRGLLTRLRNAAKLDGVVNLLLPNRRSATSMFFRRYWYHLDLPRHLHHFSPRDVDALANLCGLRVARVRHTASPSGLLGSVDCLLTSMPGRPRTRLRSKPTLRSTSRLITWPVAKVGLADVVEYDLVPSTRS